MRQPLENSSPVSAAIMECPPRRSVFREVPWRWSDLLLGFAPFILIRVVAVVFGPQSSLAAASRRLWIPLTLLNQAWMLVVPLWIARSRKAHPVRLPQPRAVLVEGLFALLFLPVAFGALIVLPPILAHLIGATEPPMAPWGPLTGSLNRIEWLLFILLAVTVAPLAEETFYRGFFYSALRQRLHPFLAAAIQAAVFGYAHPFGLPNSIAIGISALVPALLFEWRKTLLTPILLHAAMNAAALLFLTASLAADADAPRLGVFGEAGQGGCRITEVMPASAADAAGLQVGDVLTAVNVEPVADTLGLAVLIRKHRLGDTVSVEFTRAGKPHRADVVLVRLKR